MTATAPSTVDQLRDDISRGRTDNRGRTGDKRRRREHDLPDIAAAPLGTDEEAGGHPVPAAMVNRERRTRATQSPSGQPFWSAHIGIILAAIGALGAGMIVAALA